MFGGYLRRTADDLRGVTLVELLTVIAIISMLASTATVSYGSVRQYARDVRRVADMGVLQTALELYYQDHYTYPADGAPGAGGIVLGLPDSATLSDDGIGGATSGKIYLLTIAPNPGPNGLAYVYRSFNADGSDCDAAPCARYTVTFALEGKTSSLAAGVHSIGSEGIDVEAGGTPLRALPSFDTSLAAVVAGGGGRAVFFFRDAVGQVAESPAVERAAASVVAPVATGAVLLNAATSIPLANLPQYLLFFFSQPVLFVFRARRKGYGTVYNAYTRLPVDLAIVRLRRAANNAIVRSTVTDMHGRFQFIVPRGVYRLEVTKTGFQFPTDVLRAAHEDAGYLDLYHGEAIRVDDASAAVTPNVPVDPLAASATDRQIRRGAARRRAKHAVAASGLVLCTAAFVVAPTLPLAGLVGLHVVLYLFFRRVAVPRRSRTWGIVYDEEARDRGIPNAVIRMFAMPYHKLVDSAVSDGRGRYQFLVGPATVYLTVSKDGYHKTETDPIDLTRTGESTVIANDLPLRKTS